jgi:DNA-binding transcriptional MerR regulator
METISKKIKIEDGLQTAKTLAEQIGVCSRLIHYYRNTGALKAITTGKARYYFEKEAVLEFLKEKGYEGDS